MFLTFDRVTKFYGPVIGLNDVSCRIGPGITGLLGANGAGKSTLIKLASGQLRPSLGEVHLGGHSAWSTAAKRHLGYSPDLDRFYEDMTGREFVYLMARLHGFAAREARQRTERILEEVGMAERAGRRLGGYSHGMRQRIKLGQALVHDPDVLLLDEPLNGIDPGGRREINQLLVGLAARGKTLLVSSHILAEVEELADEVLVIARGRIIASGRLGEIRSLLADQPFVVEIDSPRTRQLGALLLELPEVRSVELGDETLVVRTSKPEQFFSALGRLVVDEGMEVLRVETVDAGADAVFDYLQQ